MGLELGATNAQVAEGQQLRQPVQGLQRPAPITGIAAAAQTEGYGAISVQWTVCRSFSCDCPPRVTPVLRRPTAIFGCPRGQTLHAAIGACALH